MAEFMMLMKGGDNSSEWDAYIKTLSASGRFRGGSALGMGQCVCQGDDSQSCTVSGFMRFEADSIEQVLALVPGNPVYESGGKVEVLELLVS